MSTEPYYQDEAVTLIHRDALAVLADLPSGSVDCIITSPPYFGLRDYGVEPTQWPEITFVPMVGVPCVTVPAETCALGAELSPLAFTAHLLHLFREARRVLADDGTLWLNLGDSYAGSWGAQGKTEQGLHAKVIGARANTTRSSRTGATRDGMPRAKNLFGIPGRVAFALQADGWILRNDVVWGKPNGMPESVTDRLGNRHEHLFLFSKSQRYYFDLDAIREPHAEVSIKRAAPHRADPGRAAREGRPYDGVASPQTLNLSQMNHPGGRNPGDVWMIPTVPFAGAHFAAYPPELVRRCVLASCKPGGVVLDPFSGSGTTGMVATKHGRRYVGIDLNADYLRLSLETRLAQGVLDLTGGAA